MQISAMYFVEFPENCHLAWSPLQTSFILTHNDLLIFIKPVLKLILKWLMKTHNFYLHIVRANLFFSCTNTDTLPLLIFSLVLLVCNQHPCILMLFTSFSFTGTLNSIKMLCVVLHPSLSVFHETGLVFFFTENKKDSIIYHLPHSFKEASEKM